MVHSKAIRDLARKHRADGLSWSKIAEYLIISRSSARSLVVTDYDRPKKQRGPDKILTSRDMTRIKREVRRLNSSGSRVTSTKLIHTLDLKCSAKTIQRALRQLNFKYASVR